MVIVAIYQWLEKVTSAKRFGRLTNDLLMGSIYQMLSPFWVANFLFMDHLEFPPLSLVSYGYYFPFRVLQKPVAVAVADRHYPRY